MMLKSTPCISGSTGYLYLDLKRIYQKTFQMQVINVKQLLEVQSFHFSEKVCRVAFSSSTRADDILVQNSLGSLAKLWE